MIQVKLIKTELAGILPALPNHGFFLFMAPPFETPWGHRSKAEPGKPTDTCWGVCRNGVPLELPTTDDYFGIAVIDKDRRTIVQGYYTDLLIPAYEYVAWYTENDVVMPDKDWHLICYVGYYDPAGNILYHTDFREFTIKAYTPPPPIPPVIKNFWWLLLFLPLLLLKQKK